MLRCETKYGFFYIDILELMPGQLRHKIHDTQLVFFVVLINSAATKTRQSIYSFIKGKIICPCSSARKLSTGEKNGSYTAVKFIAECFSK